MLPDQAIVALDQVGGGVMRSRLDMETPCPSDALSARFSVRGNVQTTFPFIVSKVWIVILSLIRLDLELEE